MDEKWKLSRLVGVFVVCLLCQDLSLSWCLNDEGLALLRFKERVISDPFGALSNWKKEDGEVDSCSWFGVECSDGKVVSLNLKDLCLRGTMAPELAKLVQIKSIVLRNNCFTGIIPEGIRELKELEVLDLGYNNFSGPLPAELGSNLSLILLLVDNNEHLEISSPEIYELQILSETQVDENELSNAAKGSSCRNEHVACDVAQREDAVRRRLLGSIKVLKPTSPPPSFQVLQPHVSPPVVPKAKVHPPAPTPSSPPPHSAPTPSSPPPHSPPTRSSPPPHSPPTPSSPPPHSAPASISSKKNHHLAAILAGTIGGALLILVVGVYLCKSNKVATVKPWATGLSGQLQKAFVTGVPKLKRLELEAACEDFSNVIGSSVIGTVYKGTLSTGVEIAVASVATTSAKDWSKNLEAQFRKKIDTLSKVNHKNFVNLLGYCEEEEPFTRMMVCEYAPNGTLFEHLHIKEAEHLDWGMRLRITMGIAYCLEHMHQLNSPIAHNNLNSAAVFLTEDYAAKISEFSFWNEQPSISLESNVYSFGVILFEIVTGRLPYSVDSGILEDWECDYLRGEQPLREMVDPTLTSFQEDHLELIGEVLESCVHPDPKQRPGMREVCARLKAITGITPEGAHPRLSPLWWAELEISSADAS